jgi:hypothetical protein
MRRRIVVLLAVAGVTLVWASLASAGYGISPSAGATTGPTPTFLVHLDPGDSAPTVHVGRTPEVDANGLPTDPVGSCAPTTPSTDPGTFTCQDSRMRLAPGTYYWSLSFFAADQGGAAPTLHVSGPFAFAVAAPPPNAGPVSPADGATVGPTPTFVVHAPAGATVEMIVSDSSQRLADGTPAGATVDSCELVASAEADYRCRVTDASELTPGIAYYWWAVVVVDGTRWPSAVRSFVVRASTGGGGRTSAEPHSVTFAPYLASSPHYVGKSIKQTRLSKAAYELSKYVGTPKTVAVACWSTADWENIAGGNPESGYTILGFFSTAMPRWLQLSPGICRTMETLLYHRPQYPNQYTANAVDTLTHEMIHALGVRDEAATECFAMQLNWVTAHALGVPMHYSVRLSHLSLGNYGYHPPRYVDTSRCRENGAWDLWKGSPSLPWHDFQV